MQLRLKLTDSCLHFLYTDVKWCVLLYIITLYFTNDFFEVKIAGISLVSILATLSAEALSVTVFQVTPKRTCGSDLHSRSSS
jgi:hypothetical protein